MDGCRLKGLRVIVVEDELLIALDISEALQAAGAEVAGPYASLKSALEAAQTVHADLAVLDIDLQGMEAFPAAQILCERRIPFLFYTGQPHRPPLQTTFAHVPVCIKPMPTRHLLDALNKLLQIDA